MASVASPVSFSALSPISLVNITADQSGFYLLFLRKLSLVNYPECASTLLFYNLTNGLRSRLASAVLAELCDLCQGMWITMYVSHCHTAGGNCSLSIFNLKGKWNNIGHKMSSIIDPLYIFSEEEYFNMYIQFDMHSEWLGISIRLSIKNSSLIIWAFCSIDALTSAAELNKHSDLWV